jgi:type I restriction enzyme S subunit
LINGGAWKQSEYVNEGIPVVQVTNMKNGTIDISDLKFISPSSYDRYKIHTLKEHDLIIATVGSHATQASAAGRATIVKDFAEGMLLNQNAVAFRSKSNVLDQRYLGLLGSSPKFQAYLKTAGKGAANQVRIALSSIRQFKCDLPPVRTQQQIVEVISAYYDLIENNRSRIQLLEQAARLLYREWFVRLRFPGHEHFRIKNGLPEGWEKRKIADVCETIGGGTPSTKVSDY